MSAKANNGTTSNRMDKFKDLIGPMDPKVDNQAREKLIGARVALLLKQAFFGNLATRLKLVNADEWLPTLATDGRHFYYNSRFVNMLDQKELEFGFGHEVLHCVYDHFGRRNDRDPGLWNIANDYCVNADLIKHNVGRKITTIEILHDPQYNGKSSEEIYDELYDKAEKINLSDLLDKLLDDHLGEGEGEGDGEGDEGDGNDRPKLSKAERDAIRDEFKEAVINAANNEPNAGNIPGNVKKMLKDLTEPQMNWRELLNMSLTSAIKDDYTWMRQSRRGWHMDAIMPGMNPGEEVNIAVAIDTSGSISQKMLVDFLSEVQGCMEAFTAYKIHVFCFDTRVHNPVDYTSDDIGDMAEYELGGFGGTDFEPIFNHLKEAEIDFDRLVVFTDGYPFGSWGDPDFCDTLWIIHGSNTIEAPFGTTTYYEDHRQKNAA
jgi:predicted metal-dependent peptidase